MYRPEDIEIITRFRTPDGVEHDTISAALNHRAEPTYQMWMNGNGSIVKAHNVETAYYLYLPNHSAMKDFCRESDERGITHEGIDSYGWYIWNPDDYTYHTLSEEIGNLIKSI